MSIRRNPGGSFEHNAITVEAYIHIISKITRLNSVGSFDHNPTNVLAKTHNASPKTRMISL